MRKPEANSYGKAIRRQCIWTDEIQHSSWHAYMTLHSYNILSLRDGDVQCHTQNDITVTVSPVCGYTQSDYGITVHSTYLEF